MDDFTRNLLVGITLVNFLICSLMFLKGRKQQPPLPKEKIIAARDSKKLR